MKLTKILLVVVSQSLKVARTLVIPQQVQSAADSWQNCSPLAATKFVTLAMQAKKAGEPACGCEEPACGCEPACGVAAHSNIHESSSIPAPVVDPSARVSTNRRVIQASAVYVR